MKAGVRGPSCCTGKVGSEHAQRHFLCYSFIVIRWTPRNKYVPMPTMIFFGGSKTSPEFLNFRTFRSAHNFKIVCRPRARGERIVLSIESTPLPSRRAVLRIYVFIFTARTSTASLESVTLSQTVARLEEEVLTTRIWPLKRYLENVQYFKYSVSWIHFLGSTFHKTKRLNSRWD